MITIIHGDDNASSRNFYLEKRKDAKTFKVINGEDASITDFVEALDGKSFLDDDNLIFIENFFTKKNTNQKKISEYIEKRQKDFNICFWEEKEIPKTSLSIFKNSSVNLFKIPQNLFQFLDSLTPNNFSNLVNFHNALKGTDEDMIFYMLIRQFRILIALSEPNAEQIDEIKNLADWQRQKFLNQSKKFSKADLLRIYKKLYEIDYSQKTGSASFSLLQAIDFLLADL